MSRHLKRVSAPRTWNVLRKTTKYITKPLPGPHRLEESLPVVIVLKQLGHVKTNAEAKKLLRAHQVLVDGRRVSDNKAQVGILDTLALPASQEYYRFVFDAKGRLQFIPISKEEAGVKPCKVVDKRMLKGGKLQYNLSGGRNILADKNLASTGDTLLIEVPGQKVVEKITFEKGALVYLLGGKHIGKVGVLDKVENGEITLVADGQSVTTAKKHAIVIGKNKPVVTVLRK